MSLKAPLRPARDLTIALFSKRPSTVPVHSMLGRLRCPTGREWAALPLYVKVNPLLSITYTSGGWRIKITQCPDVTAVGFGGGAVFVLQIYLADYVSSGIH